VRRVDAVQIDDPRPHPDDHAGAQQPGEQAVEVVKVRDTAALVQEINSRLLELG
jgi:hypothetical protein